MAKAAATASGPPSAAAGAGSKSKPTQRGSSGRIVRVTLATVAPAGSPVFGIPMAILVDRPAAARPAISRSRAGEGALKRHGPGRKKGTPTTPARPRISPAVGSAREVSAVVTMGTSRSAPRDGFQGRHEAGIGLRGSTWPPGLTVRLQPSKPRPRTIGGRSM